MIEGLLGKKIGMVQVFDTDGRMRGATVIETGPCVIVQIKTTDRDGYNAVQLGFGAAKRRNKPERGHLKQLGDLRYLREFNVDDPSEHTVGERVGVEMFEPGDRVNVTATSKGRGFAGVVKRHHFVGGPKTHGQSDRHRAPGSVGAGGPSRTFKGYRMGGHMGDEQVTTKRLEVLQSDPARALLIIAGSVPGGTNGLVKIRYHRQTLEAARTRELKQYEEPTETEEPKAQPEAEEAAVATDDTTEDAPEASAEEASEADSSEEADAEATSDDEATASEDDSGEGEEETTAEAIDEETGEAADSSDGEEEKS